MENTFEIDTSLSKTVQISGIYDLVLVHVIGKIHNSITKIGPRNFNASLIVA